MHPPNPSRDTDMMKRALRLAAKGAGLVSPNPLVGALIVRDGVVLARGCHRVYGGDHAEVDALKALNFQAEGCEMIVNLEPCSHTGKTPPCTEAIIRAGIRRVVVGMIDPNPLVAGRGLRRLREAGLDVEVGVLEEDSRRLNEAFIKYITTGIPFVTVKAAMSLDGRIATRDGDSGQNSGGISNEAAHRHAHRLRRDMDAILVGGGTVRADNPRLTCRLLPCPRQPLRVVLDGPGVSPPQAQIFDTREAPTLVVTSRASAPDWRKAVTARGAELWLLRGPGGQVNPSELLQGLGRRQITSVLVEGGAQVIAAFVAASLVDRFDLIYAPRLIGGDGIPLIAGEGVRALARAPRLRLDEVRRMGDDVLVRAYPITERG